MSRLRDLLQAISEPPYKSIIPSQYELLEALVEAVEGLADKREAGGEPQDACIAQLTAERDEAKAEIERLKGLLDNATTVVGSWMARCHDLENSSDAETGRLVRGMQPYARLFRGGTRYWGEQGSENGTTLWVGDEMSDPAEALRMVQKEETDGAPQSSPAPMVAGGTVRPGSAGTPEPIDLDGSG